MKTHNLGYPRIGSQRELKKASEKYWSGKIPLQELLDTGKRLRLENWKLQQNAGIDLIPSNDFSYYDQVLDMTMVVGAIPDRYRPLQNGLEQELYFAMARGYQQEGLDITAMEMTKWFDTNYHYIVPEFSKDQTFKLSSTKVPDEFKEAKEQDMLTKPVIIGPVSYLLLGKEKEEGFDRLDLMDRLLPVYLELLGQLQELGAEWVQLDEPFLAMDLGPKVKDVYRNVYNEIQKKFPHIKILVATYFEGLRDNLDWAISLPVHALHIDLMRDPKQLDFVLKKIPDNLMLSLGLVDGRNIWKNDFANTLEIIRKTASEIGEERILLAPSCSLIHVPCDLYLETNEAVLTPEIKNWLAFARQKLEELSLLKSLSTGEDHALILLQFEQNQQAAASRKASTLIHDPQVKDRVSRIGEGDTKRASAFSKRSELQHQHLNLPLFPTTTIGSFPQTTEIRQLRARFKKGKISKEDYQAELEKLTLEAVRLQEEIDLDILVHGEFERNDMVEYFGEQLEGFVFTKNGWVQSYGSRCVKPPIIYGDVSRSHAMTVNWSSYAQSSTHKTVKGMLTGPVTILQWSFVRDDQPIAQTCWQIALGIRDEVMDLEAAGIKAIQVDEPAIREGLPLRKSDWDHYLQWAVKAFRVATSAGKDETQIHTHMCYSEFNDIIKSIAEMDADVITIECSRSQMELLDAFGDFNYPNQIGPGVYDIHSPRIPSQGEMVVLLKKAAKVIPPGQLWVNPDCGLKTRQWDETKKALIQMVAAAKEMRQYVDKPK